MMTNLVRLKDGVVIWPYSLGQLRLDEPSQSFSWAPSDAELAYYNCYRVQPSTPPVVDPSVERVVQVQPTESDGVWSQQWNVIALTPEEQAAYQAQEHPPRWLEFGQVVQSSPEINALLGQALQNAPALAMALSVGLGKAADGDARVFSGAWSAAMAAGLITPELVMLTQDIATAHDLPAEFIAGLAGGAQ